MKRATWWRSGAAGALLLLATIAGCAATRKDEALRAESLLVEAGFRARPADNPDKIARLDRLPALAMQVRTTNGQSVYSYADPYRCKCLYVGGPAQYAAYQRLAVEQKIAKERVEAAKTKEDDYLDWGPWGEQLQQ